ncbi:MAG: patatin-like phospholipase family protein [Bacteroidetes bacterium]|nr:patatin-like phospholipase family protein [Bacteroidota bacterium]
MNIKDRLKIFWLSFPVQLVIMHVKKSQLLLVYWLILFACVTQNFGNRFGIPYLFLDPEYMGKVSWLAFFIIGICLGVFIMAYNISSYMLNSFRFPFLACLYKTFEKYCYNNAVLPVMFILTYIGGIYYFQLKNQLLPISIVTIQVLALLMGVGFVIFSTLKYFQHTNKDIYKLFGVATHDGDHDNVKFVSPIRDTKLKRQRRRGWKVETYLTFPFKLRLVRSTSHYKSFMLASVFRQNHINAAVLEMIIFLLFILLGLFRDYSVFRIPAGGSILLLFTMIIMIGGVFRYWLRGWAYTALVGLFILINFLSGLEVFNFKNKAYGLNYDGAQPEYSIPKMEEILSHYRLQKDYETGLVSLNNWKKKWNDAGVEKPKLVVLSVSGGGVRSALFTFNAMLELDSALNGQLLRYTQFISGSSGGLIGASYYRELFLRNKGSQKIFENKETYLKNISKDVLNATAFSFIISDLFLNFQQFNYHGKTYLKDRAYAFEEQLNENTGHIMDKQLSEYYLPELKSEIPRLVICPTVVNDGRFIVISPLPSTYLLKSKNNSNFKEAIPDGVDMMTFFEKQGAGNLRYLSALRMNATFPYIMPAAQMPSEPSFQVMDAGVRDNYGVQTSVRYLIAYRQWIKENTSGVVFVQIRDNNKYEQSKMRTIKSLWEKVMSPFKNLSSNFIVMQDYVNDSFSEYLKTIYGRQIRFIDLQMNQKEDRVSLSWHLTQKEKLYVVQEGNNELNKFNIAAFCNLLTDDKSW